MSIRVEGNQSEIADQARAFVEGLSDFLKVCILYPSSNQRVQAGADALISAQEPLFAADGKLPLMLEGDIFKIGNTKIESRKANVAWFADCCQKTNLAGMYFDRELTNGSLFALAKALHKGIGVASTATTFEEFWPEKFDGIRLLEKRYRGSFWNFEDAETGELAAWILHGLDPSSREAELTTALLESDNKLGSRMNLLRDVISEAQEDNPDSKPISTGVHPLRVILNNLPREAFRDLDDGVAKVKEVLDEMIESIKRNSAANRGNSDSLEGLARQIITRSFRQRTEIKPPSALPKKAPVVQEEPKEVAKERNELLSALERLPDNLPTALKPEDVDAPAEELGILLHQHLRTASRDSRALIESRVLTYLKSPTPESLKILDQFLHLLCSPRLKPKAQNRIAELAQSIQESEFASLLTQYKRFSKQTIVDSFPASFGLFIDSIDASDSKELEKIGIICRAIGEERTKEHRDFLGTRAGIVSPDRVKKILSLSSRDVLPLTQIILAHDSGADARVIAQYLKAQNLRGPESAALRALPDPERLPRDYFSDLCNGHAKGSFRPGLTQTSESLIHEFVREPSRSPSHTEQQARAIMVLGEFPTRETRELLMSLAKRGLLGHKKAPKPIRQAAKIVLRMLSGGR